MTTEIVDPNNPARGPGRPSDYSPLLASIICEHMTKGLSVRKIGGMEEMPCEDTIHTWLARYPHFSEKYEKAVQHRTTKYMDEGVDLADMMPDGIMFMAGNGQMYTRDGCTA